MITLALVLGLVGGAVVLFWSGKKKTRFSHEAESLGVVAALLSAVVSLAAGITFLSTFGTSQELRAFHEDVLGAYVVVAERSEVITLEAPPAFTDFAYQGLAKAVAQQLAELRERFSWYHETRQRFLGYGSLPVIGEWVSDVSDLPRLELVLEGGDR